MSICVFRNGNEGLDHSVNLVSSQDYFILKLPDLVSSKCISLISIVSLQKNETGLLDFQMLSDPQSSLSDDLSRGASHRAHRPTAPTKVGKRKVSMPLQMNALFARPVWS